MSVASLVTKARFSLAWFIMPPDVKALTLKPVDPEEVVIPRPWGAKTPTPLWIARRESMLKSGYDPRNTATP